jgi:hypothetical protein
MKRKSRRLGKASPWTDAGFVVASVFLESDHPSSLGSALEPWVTAG